jgi:hypothetical protein
VLAFTAFGGRPGERLLGFFHLGTGLWLMYLVGAAASAAEG